MKGTSRCSAVQAGYCSTSRRASNKLKYKLRYVLNSREDFDIVAMLHKRGLFHRFKNFDRAAKFYQLVRFSYASGLDSFGSQPHSLWSDFPMIDLAARRLQKVVIENKDFEKLIRLHSTGSPQAQGFTCSYQRQVPCFIQRLP